MPKHTIREAEQLLAELTEHLAPAALRRCTEEVDNARREAFEAAREYLRRHADDADQLSERMTSEIRAVRRGFNDLIRRAEAGQVSAREFHAEFTAHARTQRQAEQRMAELERAGELARYVEEHPTDWVDMHLHSKFPATRPDFTF